MIKTHWVIWCILITILWNCKSKKLKHNQSVIPNVLNLSVETANTWKAFGPFGSPISLAAADMLSPHGAGRFMCVNVHPKNKDEIMIGHASSGLFKTTDGGITWHQKLNFEFATGVFDIVRFRQNSKHLIAACALDLGISKQYGYGIIESFDNGETWQRNSLQFEPEEYNLEQCRDICVIDYKKELRLLCISDHNIYLSEDGAKTWHKIKESKYHLKNICVDPQNENSIFISGNGLLHSNDGGNTWTDLSDEINTRCGKSNNEYTRFIAGFSEKHKDRSYIILQNQSVFCLSMHGTIQPKFQLLNRNSCAPNMARMSLAIDYNKAKNIENIWVGTVRLYKSSDEGINFEQSGFPSVGRSNHMHDDINQIYLNDEGIVFAATDGGVDYSTDGGIRWNSITEKSTNLNTTLIFGADLSEQGILMCGTQDNGIFTFRNGQWYCSVMYGDGGRVAATDDSTGFACGYSQMNFYTPDAGRHFSYDHAGNERSGFEFRLSYLKNSHSFYLANTHLYRKQNKKTYEILTAGTEADRKIKAYYINPANEKEIWICRDDPTWGGELKNKLLYTNDGGYRWQDFSSNLPILQWRSITDIAVNSKGSIAITLEAFDKNKGDLHKVYFSEDGGRHFENISTGLPNLPVNTIVYASGKWICGNNNGVYTLKHKTWEKLGSGLPATIISELKYYDNKHLLLASTFGRGIWGIRLD